LDGLAEASTESERFEKNGDFYLKKYILGQCLHFSFFNLGTTNAYWVDQTRQHDFLINLVHWRDSNPGLLFLRHVALRAEVVT
jgi:hypothetical protein